MTNQKVYVLTIDKVLFSKLSQGDITSALQATFEITYKLENYTFNSVSFSQIDNLIYVTIVITLE